MSTDESHSTNHSAVGTRLCRGEDERIASEEIRWPLSNKDVTFAKAMGGQPPQIVSFEELSKGLNLHPGPFGSTVLRIRGNVIVKFGKYVNMSEAETMHILSMKASNVPVPKLYNAYTIAGKNYIVMEYIDGSSLSRCWTTMTGEEKEEIVHQLGRYVSTWRTIKGSFLGAIDGGPCRERLFAHSYDDHNVKYGPFSTRRDYNKGLVEAFRNSRPCGVETDSALESQILNTRGDEAILTHCDLHMGNIIVKDGSIAAVLDWGNSCYSIREMEYCSTLWGNGDVQWLALICKVLEGRSEIFKFWNHVQDEMRVYSGI